MNIHLSEMKRVETRTTVNQVYFNISSLARKFRSILLDKCQLLLLNILLLNMGGFDLLYHCYSLFYNISVLLEILFISTNPSYFLNQHGNPQQPFIQMNFQFLKRGKIKATIFPYIYFLLEYGLCLIPCRWTKSQEKKENSERTF